MTHKKINTKLPVAAVEGLSDFVKELLLGNPETLDDKLLYATIAEIKLICDKRLLVYQKHYQISWSIAHAFALQILQQDYFPDYTSFMGNQLMAISNQVNKQYQ